MIATLHGPWLDLRPLADRDLALYVRLYSDPGAMQHIGPAQDAVAAFAGFRAALACNAATPCVRVFWVIHDRATPQTLGLAGLSIAGTAGGEVGVLLPAPHQRRGVATEAIALMADHAFSTLRLPRLHTRHEPVHALAAGLMATLGFERLAPAARSGRWRWQLTPERWASSPRRLSTADPLTSGGLFTDGERGNG